LALVEEKKMPAEPTKEGNIALGEIILEALKGIKSEILLYAIIVAALLIGSAYFGLAVLKELKWPLIIIFSLALGAYFFAGAVPRAKRRLRNSGPAQKRSN
jgi:hypothetical protein